MAVLAPVPPATVEVAVGSAPSGATVSLDGVVIGPTPVQATLTPGKSVHLGVRLNGYEPHAQELTPWEVHSPLFEVGRTVPLQVCAR